MEQQVVKYPLAGPGIRLLARLVDVVLFYLVCIPGVAYLIINYIDDNGTLNDALISIYLFIACSLILAIIQWVFLSVRGQTIGKILFKIRIVRADDCKNGGFVSNVLLRAILNSFISLFPFYGLVDALFIFSEDNRCLHDRIAGTVVEDLKHPFIMKNYIPDEPDPEFYAHSMNYMQAPTPYYQPKANNNTVLYVILAVIGGIFALAIAAVIAINLLGGVINSAKHKAELQEAWFYSYDNSFKIKATKNWVEGNRSLNKDADFIINTKDGKQYVMAINESKSELPDSFDLEDYENAVSDAKKQVKGFEDQDFVSIDINGFEARQISFAQDTEKVKIGYLLTLIETEEGFYQVYAWTEKSDFEKYKSKLGDIVESFELN